MIKTELKTLLLEVQTETLKLVADKKYSSEAFQEVIDRILNDVEFVDDYSKYMSGQKSTQTKD